MTKIVGIRFRNVGKIYYFDPKNYKMKIGDHVIVETARGSDELYSDRKKWVRMRWSIR